MNGQAWTFANPRTNHPALRNPLTAFIVAAVPKNSPCSLYNKNGSGHHPYYACTSCGEFACLGDMREVLSENPTCLCDHVMQLTRRAIAGADGVEIRILRSMFYRCAPGGCLFLDYMTDDHDRILIYDGHASPQVLASLGF